MAADIDRNLLEEVKAYIEGAEERIEGEWGSGQSVRKLIEKKDMPDVYWKVVEYLSKL